MTLEVLLITSCIGVFIRKLIINKSAGFQMRSALFLFEIGFRKTCSQIEKCAILFKIKIDDVYELSFLSPLSMGIFHIEEKNGLSINILLLIVNML